MLAACRVIGFHVWSEIVLKKPCFKCRGSVPCRVTRVQISAVSAVSVSTVSAVSAVSGSACWPPCHASRVRVNRVTACRVAACRADFVCVSSVIVLRMQCVKCRALFHAVPPVFRFQPCQPCPCQPCQPWQACLCQRVGLCVVSAVSVSAVSRFIPCRVCVNCPAR